MAVFDSIPICDEPQRTVPISHVFDVENSDITLEHATVLADHQGLLFALYVHQVRMILGTACNPLRRLWRDWKTSRYDA